MTTQTHPISPSQRKQALVIFLIIAVVLIAIPTYFTGVELTYSLIGVTTTAQVTGNHRENRSAGKSGGRRPVFVIDYTFQESGGLQRIERDVIPEDLPFSASGPVTVEYIPGFHRVSRIQGHRAKLLHFWLFFGTGGTLFGVMAWLTWKRKDANPAASQPVPAKPTAVEQPLTREVRFGGLIVGIVGAILIGLSLLGIFGEAGGVVVAGVVALGVGLVAMEMSSRATKRHTDALRSIARELNLKFNPEGHEELHASLKRFHLATLGPYSTMSNLMFGQRDGTDIAIFEYEYPRGKNNTIRQTVIWMQRRGTRQTEFSLRPEGVWNQLGGWSGHGDIRFDSHSRFSRDYLLRGDDEEAIRELFTDDVLEFYESHPELITEGEGNKLLFYREAVLVPPQGIRSFLEETLTVRSSFQPKS